MSINSNYVYQPDIKGERADQRAQSAERPVIISVRNMAQTHRGSVNLDLLEKKKTDERVSERADRQSSRVEERAHTWGLDERQAG